MEDQLRSLAHKLKGTAVYYVKRLSTAETHAHNADKPLLAASLIKLPILWEYFHQTSAGLLNPHETMTVPNETIVGGMGVINTLEPGLRLRYSDIARLMIVVSDNTATNLLIEKLGLASITATIQQLGMAQTALQRNLMDYAARDRGLDNYISAQDVGLLLEKIVRGDGLPPSACQEMLDILHHQQMRSKLPALLPADTWIAHKTGEQTGTEHDAGIIRRDTETAVVVAMSNNLSSKPEGVAYCQQIGLTVYEHLAINI